MLIISLPSVNLTPLSTGEITINLTSTGGYQSVFLSNDGHFFATKELHCDTSLMTDLVPLTGQFFNDDCGGDVPHYNPGIGGTYYVPGYKITNPTSFADGLFVPINTSSCTTRDIMDKDYFVNKWAITTDNQCMVQPGKVDNFGRTNVTFKEVCVLKKECVYGYLGNTILKTGQPSHTKFYNKQYHCQHRVRSVYMSFASLSANIDESDLYYCWVKSGTYDQRNFRLVYYPGYVTCFYKVPENGIAISERGRCIKVLFEKYGHTLIGYSGYTDENSVIWCFPWNEGDSVVFITDTDLDLDTCLFDTKPFF
ncbi:uncharacterized protein LOC142351592 isoform X2 [Convolutriloba macropyga]|uniref:uncharacterized protein LOC142351592 isoform X2 n=1 Tax=Convolutriloba macropyga TaxID=536237 RepID=UPI003F51F4E8